MREWLAAIRLPDGFTDAFATAVRAGSRPRPTVRRADQERRSIEARIARLQDLYEPGDVTRRDYLAKREKLTAALRAVPDAQRVERASETIATLVDDWERMGAGQKRQLMETVFSDVTLEDGKLAAATPRAGCLPYLEGVLAARTPVCVGRRRRESNPR